MCPLSYKLRRWTVAAKPVDRRNTLLEEGVIFLLLPHSRDATIMQIPNSPVPFLVWSDLIILAQSGRGCSPAGRWSRRGTVRVVVRRVSVSTAMVVEAGWSNSVKQTRVVDRSDGGVLLCG